MFYDKNSWDAVYDVIVIGFGGAGATAARFSADNNAKVLLIDSAPEGHEGGNTRYAGQIVETGDDFDKLKKYYQQMTSPLELDEKVLDTFIHGMVDLPNYFRKYLGCEPYSVKKNLDAKNDKTLPFKAVEFPEFAGSETGDDLLVHPQVFDSALWKILRKNVISRSSHIDILYKAPAQHLLQTANKTIIGVQIKYADKLLNIKANNGVILALGGFENNDRMIQDYLGETNLIPYGTLYNKGDGIKMAIEVGAGLWHMNNYEPGTPTSFSIPGGQRAYFKINNWSEMFKGSLISVGDDGTRYLPEDDKSRHGHTYYHGLWRVLPVQQHPYLIFDQKKYDEFMQADNDNLQKAILNTAVKSATISDLAHTIGVDSQVLQQTIENYNFFVEQKCDYQLGRNPETMEKISMSGPFYALAKRHTMLNTQGGARRNEKAEVLDTAGRVIPHLYEAGELGHVNINQYNGGGDFADCLIFGKIAGENAAKSKDDLRADKLVPLQLSTAKSQVTESYEVGANQYIGHSTSGIGNEIAVKVTVDQKKRPVKVEVVKESESADYGEQAISQLIQEVQDAKCANVDAVSGASSTSRAFKEAVNDALSKA
ncbi:FAD-binding protein [Lactobacillus sp. ESL0791]|uniref:FAD-binding protein n=1 Tax=Lactobacillus sp. ESL0791 TaxID=2983234 RepID=UPI0023F7F67F|nr:FAD-binding protein [Lactobacillus sp. ESL0791]MDF7639764.1 FAD-binding protein [Lactobacillus sp. ESL0791]